MIRSARHRESYLASFLCARTSRNGGPESREAPTLRCGAEFTGQPTPRIDVTPSLVEPASSTGLQQEPRLLIINF